MGWKDCLQRHEIKQIFLNLQILQKYFKLIKNSIIRARCRKRLHFSIGNSSEVGKIRNMHYYIFFITCRSWKKYLTEKLSLLTAATLLKAFYCICKSCTIPVCIRTKQNLIQSCSCQVKLEFMLLGLQT